MGQPEPEKPKMNQNGQGQPANREANQPSGQPEQATPESKLQKFKKWLKIHPNFKSPEQQRDFLVALIEELERVEGLILEKKRVSRNPKGTLEDITEYAVGLKLPVGDGDWFFDHMLGSNWKNDGHPVADWKAVMRTWNRLKYFPSQKLAGRINGAGGVSETALFIAYRQELEEIERKLENLEMDHSGMQNWEDEDLAARKTFRARRKELMEKLEVRMT